MAEASSQDQSLKRQTDAMTLQIQSLKDRSVTNASSSKDQLKTQIQTINDKKARMIDADKKQKATANLSAESISPLDNVIVETTTDKSTFKHDGKEHALKIKDMKSSHGEFELHHDGSKWDLSNDSKKAYPHTAKAITATGFLNKVNKQWKTPSGNMSKDIQLGNVYHSHKDAEPINIHYGKDLKTNYIQVTGAGFYHTGNDEAKLGSPELAGKTDFRASMNKRKAKNGKYSASVVMALKDPKKSFHDLDAPLKEYTTMLPESRNNADALWDKAEEHLALANKHKNNKEAFHFHMSNHHDIKSQYHSDLGQHRQSDVHADKAEEHHELGLQKRESLEEASRAETGELFKSLVDRAHTSSEAGNHTQAKRHLANAQTARYGITHQHMAKHKASFDKYKELKHSYTNSDDHIREEAELEEAHKIHDKVEIIKGSAKGTRGHIGEIRHGAFKGAPKQYTVYHGEHDATQVSKEHIRAIKESDEQIDEKSEDSLDKIGRHKHAAMKHSDDDYKYHGHLSKYHDALANHYFQNGQKVKANKHKSLAEYHYGKHEDAASGRVSEEVGQHRLDLDKEYAKIKESDEAWAASLEKKKEDRLIPNDKDKLDKVRAMLAKEKKPVKETKYWSKTGKTAKHNETGEETHEYAEYDDEKGDATGKREYRNAKGKSMGESVEQIEEAHKIHDKVEIIKGSAKGTRGHIGEIRHGAFKGAPKQYTVYHGEHDATQVSKEHIRAIKEAVDAMANLRQAHDRHMAKALIANKGGDDAAVKVHQVYMQKIQAKMQKLKRNEETMNEDVEQIDEISKELAGNYYGKVNQQHVKKVGVKPNMYDRVEKDLGKKRKEGLDRAFNRLTKEETMNEEHLIHVSDGSKYGDEPSKKDADHVMSGVKTHNGEFDSHTDKGAVFKFKSHSDASNFKRHVDKCPGKTCYADHTESTEFKEEQISEGNTVTTRDGHIVKVGDAIGYKDGHEQYGAVHKIVGDTVHIKSYDSNTGDHYVHQKHKSEIWKEEYLVDGEQLDETWSKEQLANIKSLHTKMSKSVGLDPTKKYGTIITKSKKDREMDKAIKDEMNEISNATLTSYKQKAGEQASAADKVGDFKKGDKRFSGIVKATKKQFANDLKKEDLDESRGHKVIATFFKNRKSWNKAASERDAKHDEIEKKRQAEKAAGKENMSSAIDRLAKHVNEEGEGGVAANNAGDGKIAGFAGDAGKKAVMSKKILQRKTLGDFKKFVSQEHDEN